MAHYVASAIERRTESAFRLPLQKMDYQHGREHILNMVEKTYERLTLATEQLETALSLFLDQHSYASAITLAGASEEIFGKALSQRGQIPAVENSYAVVSEFHIMLHGSELDKKSYIAEENFARDALKHLQENRGPTIVIDLEEAACWMLVRALKNARELGMECERARDFDNWFYENMVGV